MDKALHKTLRKQAEYLLPGNERKTEPDLQASSWWMAIGFAVGSLGLGMLAAGWGYSLNSGYERSVIDPPLYPPDWFFWMIWLVLYPLLGISTWMVWRCRQTAAARIALVIFAVHFLVNLSWVPVVHATQSTVVVPVLMDMTVDIFVAVAAIGYWRISKPAFHWLIPYLIWNIFTTLVKIWRLLLNAGIW